MLHYPFAIPDPNWYARLRVNFAYDTSNVAIAVVATTGDPTDFGPPGGGIVVPAEPQVRIIDGTLSVRQRTGTTTIDMWLWPAGATRGDLYIVFIPTSWMADSPTTTNIARASICKPSIELDTFTKSIAWTGTGAAEVGRVPMDLSPLDQSPNENSFVRDQMSGQTNAAEGIDGRYVTWMRDGFDPEANQGAGAWFDLAEETETVSAIIHTPKDTNASLKHIVDAFRSTVHADSWNTPTKHDPLQEVSTFRIDLAPVDATINTAQKLEAWMRDGSSLDFDPDLSAEMKVNASFWGTLAISDHYIRNVRGQLRAEFKHESGEHCGGRFVWDGLGTTCTDDWPTTPTLGPRLVPYPVPSQGMSTVTAFNYVLQAGLDRLLIEAEGPVGPKATVDVDLDCLLSSPSPSCF